MQEYVDKKGVCISIHWVVSGKTWTFTINRPCLIILQKRKIAAWQIAKHLTF